VEIAPLPPGRLADVIEIVSLPHDRFSVVAEEKIYGENPREDARWGAFVDGALAGVLITAGKWIKLLAVGENFRRRGIGSALLAKLERARVLDHPGNYLSPGLDIRYGEARAFFEKRGFRAVAEVENIRSPLDARIDREISTPPGYQIRRAHAEEPLLLDWISQQFHPVWAFEVARALAGPRRAVHVAMQQNSYVGFAAADGNNQGLGWFGPAGTHPDHRGKKLGEALLLHCLRDVRGLPEAGVIAWIGPKEFYAKACGAVDDRRFIQLERP
jgi:GNAT superfamily N-acetyltransferase